MPKRGLHLTSDAAESYLKAAGLTPLQIYSELESLPKRTVNGVQQVPLKVYQCFRVELIARRYAPIAPDIWHWLTPTQRRSLKRWLASNSYGYDRILRRQSRGGSSLSS